MPVARVLAAWGGGGGFRGEADLQVSPARLALGGSLQLSLTLQAGGRQAQVLVVDYAVHHVKAHGGTSAKVFKGWSLTLAPGESRTLIKQHAVKPITTRRYYPGWHRVTVQINGQTVAEAGFELLDGTS